MKRGFIRTLWGKHDNSHPFLARRERVDRNINDIVKSQWNFPFVTYVMGKDNFNFLKNLGFNCILISENPALFDPINHKYRNKLEAIKYAMEVDGYDEMVYLDWDCVLKKQLPSNFWEILGKKEKIQANLQIYRRKKVFWRPIDQRKVPNGGFIYLRDKSIPSQVIKIWEEGGKHDNDEMAWGEYIDGLTGGWKGIDQYWNLFEPSSCNLWVFSAFTREKLSEKEDPCFRHYQGAL
jgi:hypothetical protein